MNYNDDINNNINDIDDDDAIYQLTPKGIFTLALIDTGLVDTIEDKRINAAWTIFRLLMDKNGYISENNEFERKLP